MNPRLSLPLFSITVLLSACTGHTTRPYAQAAKVKPLAEAAPPNYASPCAISPTTTEQRHACDRRSILAMAGEFRVRFAFDETAALSPGYVPREAQRSGGTELVEVIKDERDTISLQHILVMKIDDKVHVIKHWRQDWHYQPAELLRFRGNGRFEREPLAAEAVRGQWSQVVYEVDDAPRYSGLGHWRHEDGVDAWTSDVTLRPLPRREYTKRQDYQAIEAINRHTLTPAGWIHEQDNTKVTVDAAGNRRAISRERGINSYARIADFDFAPGRDYWTKTRDYWARVRAEWERGIASQRAFVLTPEPNGEPRIEKLFEQAAKVGNGETVSMADIDAVLSEYGLPLPTASAGR
ncbi:DUF6607 family protein [Dokdonella sp.]|uniref:DUF6607 family protein n=2 Tax=Dokdonella sp. TaxID=2291710 RepID=UPI002C7CD523|nr:DUF6607 family protein [Dokdonella sp.]HPN78337.1 hypothetical protein [Dokdonella sp.]